MNKQDNFNAIGHARIVHRLGRCATQRAPLADRILFALKRAISGNTAGPARLVRRLLTTLGTIAVVMVPAPGYAALLNLSPTPLFLQNAVQPNIFFMLDDSGSMDWETVYNPGTNCNSANGTSTLDFSPDTSGSLSGCPSGGSTAYTYTVVQVERLRLCVGFNTLAYDPNITYTPWYGEDSAGVDYRNAWLYGGGTDASPNYNVRNNPFLTTGTFNLGATGIVAYRPWTDSNSNGDYEDGECGDKNSSTPNVMFENLSDAHKKNFSNWYTYYRKREYVMKRAISEIIYNGRARMGLSTLWRNSVSGSSVGRKIENVDDISVPLNATAATSKTTLLNHLSRIDSSGGTPLRDALDEVGRYIQGGSSSAFSALFGSSSTHSTAETINQYSPILNAANGGSCQQNFLVMMSDGYYNSGYSGTSVGNADGNSSSAFDSASSGAGSRPYGDSRSATLGDIAMHYYERDLRSDLLNRVPYTPNFDPKTPGAVTPGDASTDDIEVVNGVPDPTHLASGILMHQHLTTYTVAFGLSGNLDPHNATASICDSDPTNACWVGWPNLNPSSMEDTPNAVDDMWHAAYNGRGEFLSGRNPTLLAAALNSALASIGSRTGTASSVAVSAAGVSTSARLYLPKFTSGEWSGKLIVYQFNSDDDLEEASDWGATPSDAGEILKTQDWNTGRSILTWNGSQGIPFRWGNLAPTQQAALNTNPGTGTSDGLGQQRIEYIRGDHSRERPVGVYRQRTNSYVLGDIVNSAAVYVGAPNGYYPDSLESVPWTSFRYANRNRKPMVYVGANDGMLHGFAVCTSSSAPGCSSSDLGREKVAYVPSKVFSNLNQLPDPSYTHNYYVDGTPSVADVFYGSAWHTILVGGLRAGGQGIYALDATDPTQFSEGNASTLARWEFTDVNDPDLGYTFSQPYIAKSHAATGRRWVAVFGNGYNNTQADGNASSTGHAALYIVDVEDGSLIRKISLTTDGGTVATPNGLASPRLVDANGDGVADFAYAGDLRGNVWKFNLTHNDPTNWSASLLFTAMDASSNRQPITSAPMVTFHPGGVGGFMVYFGTGKYLESGGADTANTQMQTFYGVWDRQGINTSTPLAAVSTSALQTQTISTAVVASQTVRTISNNPINNWGTAAGQHMGWKISLPTSGERVVSAPQYVGTGRVLFVTIIPDSDPCAAGGTSWLMQVNTLNGSMPPSAVFDVNNDGELGATDNSGGNVVVGVQTGVGISPSPVVLDSGSGRIILTPGSGSSTLDKQKSDANPDKGRQSWRQQQ